MKHVQYLEETGSSCSRVASLFLHPIFDAFVESEPGFGRRRQGAFLLPWFDEKEAGRTSE